MLKKYLLALLILIDCGPLRVWAGPDWKVSSAGATYLSKSRPQRRIIHPLWSELLRLEPLNALDESPEPTRMDLLGYQMTSPTRADILVQIYDPRTEQFQKLKLTQVDLSVTQAKEGFSTLGRRARLPFSLAIDSRSFVGRAMPSFAVSAKTVKMFGLNTPPEIVSEAGTVDRLLGFQLVSLQLNEFYELEVKGNAIYGPKGSEFPVEVLQLSKVRKTFNRIAINNAEELTQALRFLRMPELSEKIVRSVRFGLAASGEPLACEGLF